MNAPLFDSVVDMEDQPLRNGGGVKWDDGVQDNNRKDPKNTTNGPFNPDKTTGPGLYSNFLNSTKIGFDNRKFDELYGEKKAEKIWLDFGKGTTNVVSYNPMVSTNINFNAHKLYYMLPPKSKLQPSNVLLFELVYLSGKDPSKDITMGWGALPLVNGEFNINTGKFKVPLIYGAIDFQTNKFKDLE